MNTGTLHLYRLKSPGGRRSSQSGFTLLELVLASMLLAMVVASVFITMNAGMAALRSGNENLELYQDVRIGIARLQTQLRNAISPESQWKPNNQYQDDESLVNFGMLVEDEEQGNIVFKGSEKEVSFARKAFTVLQAVEKADEDAPPPSLDIQEVRVFHDSDKKQIKFETVRHLTEVRLAVWFYAQEYEMNLEGIVVGGQNPSTRVRYRQVRSEDEYLLEDLAGDVGWDGAQVVYMNNIKQFKLSYFGEDGWVNTWDSRQVIQEQIQRSEVRDIKNADGIYYREKGLPTAVAMVFELTNGQQMATMVDIPASSLNQASAEDIFRGRTSTTITGSDEAGGASSGPVTGENPNRPVNETPAAIPQ